MARRRAERTALAGNIRRAAGGSDEDSSGSSATPRGPRQGALTGRLLLILVLVGVCMTLIAPQLKIFMQQRQEVAELKADIAAKERQKSELSLEVKRYDDEAFLRQQARDRLLMVKPGEIRYSLTGQLPDSSEALSGTAASRQTKTWHESYIDAIRTAAR